MCLIIVPKKHGGATRNRGSFVNLFGRKPGVFATVVVRFTNGCCNYFAARSQRSNNKHCDFGQRTFIFCCHLGNQHSPAVRTDGGAFCVLGCFGCHSALCTCVEMCEGEIALAIALILMTVVALAAVACASIAKIEDDRLAMHDVGASLLEFVAHNHDETSYLREPCVSDTAL